MVLRTEKGMIDIEYGYINTSSNQLIEVDMLHGAGLDDQHIFIDNKHRDLDLFIKDGKVLALQKDDILVITSLEALGYNYSDIKARWKYITGAGIKIKVIEIPISNIVSEEKYAMFSDVMLQVLDYLIKKHTIDTEKTKRGRPYAAYPVNWKEVYDLWQQGRITAKVAMERAGVKYTTFYNLASRYEKELGISRSMIHGKKIERGGNETI